MMGIGFPELMVILVIIMIIFGAGKLPEIGSAFGKSIKNFKGSMKEAEAEELESSTATETAEAPAEGAEGQATETANASTEAGKEKKKAAKKEGDLIDEAAKDIEKNLIGTIRTKHDGLVQEGDVFTSSLGRTPGGRGRDRGVSRDAF